MMVEFSDKCGTKAYGRDTRRVVRTYPIVPSLIVAHSHKGELSNRCHIVVVKTCTLLTVSVSISVRQGQDRTGPITTWLSYPRFVVGIHLCDWRIGKEPTDGFPPTSCGNDQEGNENVLVFYCFPMSSYTVR